jgi:hypothetical protein
MNFKTHAPARREGTTLQPNIHKIAVRAKGYWAEKLIFTLHN